MKHWNDFAALRQFTIWSGKLPVNFATLTENGNMFSTRCGLTKKCLHTVKPVKQIRVWKLHPAKRARGQCSHTVMKSIYGDYWSKNLMMDVAAQTLIWHTKVSFVQWLYEVLNKPGKNWTPVLHVTGHC
jgi:hypothetical protein